MFHDPGKTLVLVGLAVVFAGAILMVLQKTGIPDALRWFGRLPLDITIEKNNFRFYFPLGSSLLVSALISLILFLISKLIR